MFNHSIVSLTEAVESVGVEILGGGESRETLMACVWSMDVGKFNALGDRAKKAMCMTKCSHEVMIRSVTVLV